MINVNHLRGCSEGGIQDTELADREGGYDGITKSRIWDGRAA